MPLRYCVNEKEANHKLCPLSLLAEPENRPWGCRGSDCMAWRYVWTNIDDGAGGTMPSGDTHGYCGLAGPPSTARE